MKSKFAGFVLSLAAMLQYFFVVGYVINEFDPSKWVSFGVGGIIILLATLIFVGGFFGLIGVILD